MNKKYWIKLWDNEKIEITGEVFNKLWHGEFIENMVITKIGKVIVPLKNIKLFYEIDMEKVK